MSALVERVRLNAVLVAVGAGAAVLGTVKTVAEAVTGSAFSVGDLAYYIGNVALVAYYGIAACFVLFVAMLMLNERIERRWTPSAAWDLVFVAVPLLAGLAAGVYAVLTFEWDPAAEGRVWAVIIRLVGVVAVVSAVLAYRRPSEASG